ncbi:conserved exported hypothetical protein [Alteromonas sp. 38]|uniref:hypothetical protein n=1 Tax=Alteromonas TaxID=226 RepID=UPI0012F2AA93|nr:MULTISPECIES: hypothetical protein [Alteromonas]CAD5256335.1 conserved exported hypothetical protein [Alteromonas sp. 154]VXA93834.1 conserved exported hypothetical protein [Alteromonas sp. 38]
MKKSIIALFAAAAMSAGVSAQDAEGGAGTTGLGAVTAPVVATAAVVAGVVAGVVSNNSSTAVDDEGTATCEGDDPLVDGVCVGTTNTVTVTGTATATSTITVPVTFTYAPTVQ